VGGVYTRDVQPCFPPTSPVAASAVCRRVKVDNVGSCVESAAVSSDDDISHRTPVTDRVTASSVSPSTQQTTPVAADDLSATFSLQAAASQLPLTSPQLPSLGSPPVKPGILPPTANVSVDSTLVGAVTDASEDWKEFEEALSGEFVSFSATSVVMAGSRQSNAAVSSGRHTQQQEMLRARLPSLMMISTVLHLLTLSFSRHL